MNSTPEWNATIELRGTRVALRPPGEVELEGSSKGFRARLIGTFKSFAEWVVVPGAELRRMRRRAASVMAPEFCGLARELAVWECLVVWQSFQGAMAAWSAEVLRRAHDEASAAYAANSRKGGGAEGGGIERASAPHAGAGISGTFPSPGFKVIKPGDRAPWYMGGEPIGTDECRRREM